MRAVHLLPESAPLWTTHCMCVCTSHRLLWMRQRSLTTHLLNVSGPFRGLHSVVFEMAGLMFAWINTELWFTTLEPFSILFTDAFSHVACIWDVHADQCFSSAALSSAAPQSGLINHTVWHDPQSNNCKMNTAYWRSKTMLLAAVCGAAAGTTEGNIPRSNGKNVHICLKQPKQLPLLGFICDLVWSVLTLLQGFVFLAAYITVRMWMETN